MELRGGQFAAILVTLPASGRAWADYARGELGVEGRRERRTVIYTLCSADVV